MYVSVEQQAAWSKEKCFCKIKTKTLEWFFRSFFPFEILLSFQPENRSFSQDRCLLWSTNRAWLATFILKHGRCFVAFITNIYQSVHTWLAWPKRTLNTAFLVWPHVWAAYWIYEPFPFWEGGCWKMHSRLSFNFQNPRRADGPAGDLGLVRLRKAAGNQGDHVEMMAGWARAITFIRSKQNQIQNITEE
jgi:hypothetical protein